MSDLTDRMRHHSATLDRQLFMEAAARIEALEAALRETSGDSSAHWTAELLRLKNRFDTIFNNVLCDMTPGWDDSIEGFNKAWDVARDIFQEEIGRAAQRALVPEQENVGIGCGKSVIEPWG